MFEEMINAHKSRDQRVRTYDKTEWMINAYKKSEQMKD